MGGSKSSEAMKEKQPNHWSLGPYILSLFLFLSYFMIVIGYFHLTERNEILYQKVYTLENKNHYWDEAFRTFRGGLNNWIKELQRLELNLSQVNTSINLLQKEFIVSYTVNEEEYLYNKIYQLEYSKDLVNRKIFKIHDWIRKVEVFMKSSCTNMSDFNTSLTLLQKQFILADKRIIDNSFTNWGASIAINRLQSQLDTYQTHSQHTLQNISTDFLSGCQLEIRYTESFDSDPPSTSNLAKKTNSQWQCAAYRTGPLVKQEDMKWIVRNLPVRICIKCE